MPPNGTPNTEGTVHDHREERRPERRVHLSEAAELLGVSKDAVRMRVKCGTLRSEKGEDGRVYVWVNVNPDGAQNTVHPQGEAEAWRGLIDELRDRVRSLEDANRENRRIIAALTQRIPELDVPVSPEPPGGSETTAEEPERAEPRSSTGGPMAEGYGRPRDTAEFPMRGGSLLRPWWKRVFGG